MTGKPDNITGRRWVARFLVHFFAALFAMGTASSCIDEIEYPEGEIPEGNTTVMAEVRFTPLVEAALDGTSSRANGLEFGSGNTNAPTGDSMDAISSLYLLFYTADGNLIPDLTYEVDLAKNKPVLEDRVDEDASNGTSAQEKTYCVNNITMTLPNGVYKMFAVANIPDLLTAHSEAIKTVAGLRGIKLVWVAGDISANSEMLGFFTNGKKSTLGNNFEAEETVVVSPKNNMLHAWIRRAASKLTIDFNGSKLRDNVFVYIKEARVYDIADGCYLGHYSCVGEPSTNKDDIQAKGGFGLGRSEHVLVYGAGSDADYENWPVVTRGSNFEKYVVDGDSISLHDEKAYCLPFYENMQGTGALKYQDGDGDGIVDYPNAGDHTGEGADRKWTYKEAKDSKPNGTWVEVIGHYESRNTDYVSGGEIKYRFMIGKNITNNFDVERNHHYKLTLCFKGNGNDADWHIEYEEEPGIHLPSPLYISYLYNKDLKFPIRINTGGKKLKSVKIDITRNNWAPYFEGGYDKDDLDYYEEADKKGEYGTKYPEYGFLSLVKTTERTIVYSNLSLSGQALSDARLKHIKDHYEKELTDEGELKISRGHRTYLVSPGEHGEESNGKYVVRQDGNIVELEVPLYTRAKNLVKETAYTGNNPYFGYPRLANITVTATYTDGSEYVIPDIPVYQVRRLVNPKGIFRSHNNKKSFHVTLMEKQHEASEKFEALKSIGPWKAYVLTQTEPFIDLNGAQEVSGSTSTPVDFMVNFADTIPADKNRFAIIEVEYHNFSCKHQIFVRQGEAPVRIFDQLTDKKAVYWHSYNMLLKDKEVSSPLDEGSMFRFGKWDYPIDASNNKNSRSPWTLVGADDFIGGGGPYLKAGTGSTMMEWADISSEASTATFPDQKDSKGNVYSLPLLSEIRALRDNTEQAFGVLYGDDATGVCDGLVSSYEYRRDANGNVNGEYGMRGCFAYIDDPNSKYYGINLFFPIGSSGYGHRKNAGKHGKWGDAETYAGQLRYAAGRTNKMLNTGNELNSPLFYDLYMRTGALYWAKMAEDSYIGMDINYYTFDFNAIDTPSTFGSASGGGNEHLGAGNSDACFIRCVDRK